MAGILWQKERYAILPRLKSVQRMETQDSRSPNSRGAEPYEKRGTDKVEEQLAARDGYINISSRQLSPPLRRAEVTPTSDRSKRVG